ncbi:MAG TPA: 2-dehydropantoate 2-reductase [Gammaproteobacteria bacterium]|nr:2-dehydropantoate 2-reductase [Gammaproteobacteria bacterium]
MNKPSQKSYAIIGTGAIGGFCAVKLKQAGFDVHCLLNRDYEFVKQNGLNLIEDNKPTTVFIKAYDDIHKIPKCDVVLIALKSTANHILKNSLSHLLHKNSIVGIVQNGIGIESEIAEFIDPEKIVGASNLLKVTKTSPGVIKHFGWDLFEWAQYYTDDTHKEISVAAQSIADDFKNAGLNSTSHPHLPTIRWKKLAANIPTSGLAVVLDAYTNELINNPSSFEILKSMTQEVISVALQCGADIPNDFYDFRMKAFEKMGEMEKNNFSMKDDYDAGNKLELHAIYENAINIAKKHGISMPLTEMLYLQLLYLEAKRGHV